MTDSDFSYKAPRRMDFRSTTSWYYTRDQSLLKGSLVHTDTDKFITMNRLGSIYKWHLFSSPPLSLSRTRINSISRTRSIMSSANKLVLYSFPTPNGVAVSILLEELKVRCWIDLEVSRYHVILTESCDRLHTADRIMSEYTNCIWRCIWRKRTEDGIRRVVKMSIMDSDIGKVHNQVKSPWFLEVSSLYRYRLAC